MKGTLWLALALGLGLRLGWAWWAPIPPLKDAAEYQALARHLVAGDGYVDSVGRPTAFRPPGWPLLLGCVYRLAGASPSAARVVASLIGVALVPLCAVIARRLGGQRAATLAAFTAAIYPPFVSSYFSPRGLLSEVLLTTLATAALALGVVSLEAGRAGRRYCALACGVLAGFAILCKGTLVFLPPLIAAALIAAGWTTGARRAAAASALLVLVGAGSVVAPWMVRNRMALGSWVVVSTNGGISLWASYNPASRGLGNSAEGYGLALAEDARLATLGLGEVARSRAFASRAREEILAHPRRALWLVLRKSLLFWDPTLKDWSLADPPLAYNWAYAAILPLALGGAVVGLRAAPTRRRSALLVGFVVVLSGLHVLVHTDVRYRVTLEPVLIVLAATAASSVVERWGLRSSIVLGGAWLLLHAAVGSSYETVFALLSRLTTKLGLG